MTVNLRPNPFSPGKRLVRPELFSGRRTQLQQGMRLLVQAAHGNARHALITGDRAIGKSSLSSQIQGLARSDPTYLQSFGISREAFPHEFMVVEYIAQQHDTVAQVAGGLLEAIERAHQKLRPRFQWEVQLDFGLLKAKVIDAAKPRDSTVAFVDSIEKIFKSLPGFAGVLLVIDEIDRVAEQPGVATFFKVVTETMTARRLDNVALLTVGMVGVKELLKAEHPSVGRVFDVIHVPVLMEAEAMDLVTIGLDGTGVTIDEATNRAIALLAGGFPHVVHLLASEAFEANDDQTIDQRDLNKALHSIVSERVREEFDAEFLKAGSGKNRQILKAIAKAQVRDVAVSHICEVLQVSQPEISSNLNILMNRDVIVRCDRGVYRFKDPLFRIYVGTLDIFGSEPVERRPRRRTTTRKR